MRVNLVKRFSKGLQLNANYTWGRAMTNSSSLAEATVQNPYDLRSGMGARQHRPAAHLPTRLRLRVPVRPKQALGQPAGTRS